jgi:hypothetical protein
VGASAVLGKPEIGQTIAFSSGASSLPLNIEISRETEHLRN